MPMHATRVSMLRAERHNERQQVPNADPDSDSEYESEVELQNRQDRGQPEPDANRASTGEFLAKDQLAG